MYWLRTWQLGIKSLAMHPLRSMLTVLGIFIGVASVIWLLAIGEGISRKAQEQIEDLGANNIIIRSVKTVPDTATDTSNMVAKYGVTREDYDKLVGQLGPYLKRALKIREYRRTAMYGNKEMRVRLVGCTPDYADVMRLHLDQGSFITPSHMTPGDNVCVLSSEVAKNLFGHRDPLRQAIRIKEAEKTFVVVGVMKSRTAMAGIGGSLAAQDFNADIYIPITTWDKQIGDYLSDRSSGSRSDDEVQLNQITLELNSSNHVDEAATAIKRILMRSHPNVVDYTVVVPQELLEQAKTTRMMFMIFMGLIAAISLLVGGIGIMNIMLATVTERTREIGIRRAIGARRSDITRQFLVETIVLSVAGGATGILGGLLCPPLVDFARLLLENYAPKAMANLPESVRDVSPIIVPWSIALAFGISVVVGVAFGLYPAQRAAKMDPIEALRHE